METKKVGFSEQLLSPRRKVVSGFGFGVGVSVIVFFSVVLLSSKSFKSPLTNSMFQGFNKNIQGGSKSNSSSVSWHFSFSSSTPSYYSSSAVGVNVSESNVEEVGGSNFTEMVKNGSFVVEEGSLVDRSHASSVDGNGNGNSSVFSKEGLVLEKTHLGNLSMVQKNDSLVDEHARVISQDGIGLKVPTGENVIKIKGLDGNFVGENLKENNVNKSKSNVGNLSSSGGNLGEKSNASKSYNGSLFTKSVSSLSAGCDIFDGRWVRDDSKPYYPPGSCPHIDRDFDCHLNGRPDDGFLRWTWRPNGCEIPSLNATDFLERLRGRKLVFVGDSLNRNMWESLVCILRHNIKDQKRVYEISGRTEFKKKGFYAFRFEDYDCTVDFVSAPFLVRESSFKGRNGTLDTLRLDLMDRTTSMYHDADVIIFNTGHWWTHEKTSRGEYYYQEGNYVHPRLKVLEAYKRALTTWARWVDMNIDRNRTQVFFRGYSVTHFRGGQWNSGGQCHKEVEPIFNQTYLAKYPSKMRALEHVLQEMKTPVLYLNISRLTDYRKDGHPSIYRMEYKTTEERIAAERYQDCSHWCLPGVPDTWNELLYASLLKAGRGSWGS